jgi:pyruvate,water dikinase
MTPFGQDNIRAVFAGAASLFGYNLTVETQPVIYSAGQRLFGDLSALIRHPLGRRAIHFFIRFVEPGSANVIGQLLQDPCFQSSKQWFKLNTAKRVGKFLAPIIPRYGRTLRHPNRARLEFEEEAQILVADLGRQIEETTSLAERIKLQEEMIKGMFPFLLPRFIPLIGVAMASLNLLNRLAASVGRENALAVTRGLPHNVTTQMDLALWQTAATIKDDPPSASLFQAQDSQELSRLYRDQKLSPVAQNAVAQFMQHYGMRGIGEIDIGRSRWREDPFQILQLLKNYLQITDPALAPDAVFRRSQKEAEESIAELEQAVNHGLFGRLRAKLVRGAAHRVRTLSGIRETPKFIMIQVMGLLRESILDSGQQLVDAGILQQAGDLFLLNFHEIRELADGQPGRWSDLIAERRLAMERESHRQQIPRFLLSDGQAYYEADYQEGQSTGDLQGSPVSPGLAEGKVRVVIDPSNVQLQPGEILVCQGTDPAWTPLFLSAGGLIMEVGGLMTHGSVVAREYGIPAVVGVTQATTRLRDGQRIRVDGNTGKIILLEQTT